MIKNRGITLFIAVVIMSILLFISFAAVNIAIKSSLFAGSGRDSQYAFYAADAGLECAEYWDSKYDYFATSTNGNIISCVPSTNIFTNSEINMPTSPVQNSIIGGDAAKNNPVQANTSIFYFDMNWGINPTFNCVIVTVEKKYVGNVLTTHIRSKGYNTYVTTNPRRVERGVEVTY